MIEQQIKRHLLSVIKNNGWCPGELKCLECPLFSNRPDNFCSTRQFYGNRQKSALNYYVNTYGNENMIVDMVEILL